MHQIKVVHSAKNDKGHADFYIVPITCTEEDYQQGKHEEMAREVLVERGLTPLFAYDSTDPAGSKDLSNWIHKAVTL